MVSPQKEDGYTPIANEIVEALCKINLSPYESRVLWYIFRKTYGWSKKTDWISLGQFSKDIGLDRRLIHRAIKKLSSKKMIVIYKDDTFKIRYGFQKNFEKWKVSSKKMTVIHRDDKVSSKEMIKVSSIEIPTKTITTKEPIQKQIELPDFIPLGLWKDFKKHRTKLRSPMTLKAEELAIKKLKKFNKELGQDPILIIEQSIERGWKGLFPLKGKVKNGIKETDSGDDNEFLRGLRERNNEFTDGDIL